MCVVCTEWEKGKLTNNEAKRGLFELASNATEKEMKHYQDVWYDIEEDDLNGEPD